jgi:hypothetical protein
MGHMDELGTKRRWYLPTPAWLVWGAAVAAGVLYACERWRWFPIHYQKGWPVLLAVAVVAAVLVLLPLWMLAGMIFKRRVQFGLATLLVFVTLSAVVCSWLTVRIKQARRQAEVVVAIRGESKAQVWYDWPLDDLSETNPDPPPPVPKPLTKLLGEDFFGDVDVLWLIGPQVSDATLARAAWLRIISTVWIDSDYVTDTGLLHLERLIDVKNVCLVGTKVTPDGVKRLQSVLPNCHISVSERAGFL